MRFFILTCVLVCCSSALWAQGPRRAENFTAVTMSGQTVELSALKGKVVLLTFWSTSCLICQSEIPKLNRMAAGYTGSDNVVFLAATMENEDKVRSFTRRTPFNFSILPNSFGLVLKYAERDRSGNLDMGFPAYFVIDQDGIVRHRSSGYDKT